MFILSFFDGALHRWCTNRFSKLFQCSLPDQTDNAHRRWHRTSLLLMARTVREPAELPKTADKAAPPRFTGLYSSHPWHNYILKLYANWLISCALIIILDCTVKPGLGRTVRRCFHLFFTEGCFECIISQESNYCLNSVKWTELISYDPRPPHQSPIFFFL